ncbi:hypothetical protein [Amycolatopsis tolypomycina]|uniref:Uncharacterized protein n=1 Tax=Amycolatopsis tolypomycina TaxID=208445 RepID=A0A1H4JEC1_9PSEU|nr:hypothetical protein [Amycolatopsis tolypomycina]SEB44699.1 hypothetical protein SAMN04489727_1822 [Amycolatopsis tolypomycina]
MDEQMLAREFTAAVRAEPPLGFDPDEVVTRVARRRHRRRAVLLACAGVVVAAAAAVAIPVTRPAADVPPRPAAPPRPAPSAGERWWPPGTGEIAQPTDARISARAPRIAEHLEALLRKMRPPGEPIRRDSLTSAHFGGIMPTSQRGVSITERGGPEATAYSLTVEVFVPTNPVQRFQPQQLCAELKVQISPSTTCRYAAVGAGGILMTSEADTFDREGTLQRGITVTDYRADGSYVLVSLGGTVGVIAPLAMTAEELATVARDPGLTL